MADDDEDMEQIVAEINAAIAAMTPTQYYRYFRSSSVKLALKMRKFTKTQPMARELLRDTQLRMVRLRADFHAGVKPTH